MGGRRDRALVAAGIAGRICVIIIDVSGLVLDAFFSIRAVSIRAFVPVVRAVLAPIAVAVLMGGRRDRALVAAGVAGRIRVIGVDVRGLVLDAFFSIRAVSIRAFVPVARAVLAPVAVAVLVGGRRDGALVAANIAGRIRVIGVDVCSLVLDAFFSIRAVSIRAFVPVVRAVLAPIAVAVLMGGWRDGALVAANIAGRIRVIVIDVCGLVIDAFFPIRAVIVGALVPVVRAVPAPIAVAVLMGGWRDGALVAANIAGRIRVIVIDVCGLVIDAFFPIRAVIVGAFVPVACAVLAPIAVAVLMRGRRVFGYRNRQLLRIAARAVGSLDGEGGASRCGRRAADFAGVLVQAQAVGQSAAANAPCDGRSAGGGQNLAVRLAHLAVRQGVRGDGHAMAAGSKLRRQLGYIRRNVISRFVELAIAAKPLKVVVGISVGAGQAVGRRRGKALAAFHNDLNILRAITQLAAVKIEGNGFQPARAQRAGVQDFKDGAETEELEGERSIGAGIIAGQIVPAANHTVR